MSSQATVLVVEDDAALREALHDTLDIAGFPVTVADSGRSALDVIARQDVSMVISDVQMNPMDGFSLLKKIKNDKPEIPVLLMTAFGNIQKAVEAMQNGASDYLVKPFEAEVLVNTVGRYITQDAEGESRFIAADDTSKKLMALANRVAESDATVMITGESGSGKEVLARYIHEQSSRAEKPFVAINCAAIPDNMLEATLFGYEKGAFTGAYQASPGKFEQAQGGTLLLDEISEMDLGLQAKLLRVLQEREVERLGGRKVIPLDVRVLATSNRNMKVEVEKNRFREDLYFRLNVFPLHISPLRERREDILPIAERLLERNAQRDGRVIPGFSDEAKQKLVSHSWLGNVRELDNVIQRALILQPGDSIGVNDIQYEANESVASDRGAVAIENHELSTSGESQPQADLKSYEQQLILDILESVKGNRKLASEKLGISQRTLRYKLARMRDSGIEVPTAYGAESA
ncbi:MAG: sigma-54-dependent transcriptional regulator [Gammaproteobacteria bacterium]